MLLALSPQSIHHSHYPSAHMASNIMSLAMHPAPSMEQDRVPALAAVSDAAPSPSKRPKLSLNTVAAPVTLFGKSSTSLRLDTLTATSPTARNTFRNAYNQNTSQRKQSSQSPQQPRSPRSPRLKKIRSSSNLLTTSPFNFDITADATSKTRAQETPSPSYSTAMAISTVDAMTLEAPYKLALNVISILTNSPLVLDPQQKASPSQSPSKPRLKKTVTFSEPLTEEITTTKFTKRHSDIESDASVSTLELSPPEHTGPRVVTETTAKGRKISIMTQNVEDSPRSESVQDSSSDSDSDSSPKTPIAGRKRRHHQWVWTLGPTDVSHGHDGDISMDDDFCMKEQPALIFEGEQGL